MFHYATIRVALLCVLGLLCAVGGWARPDLTDEMYAPGNLKTLGCKAPDKLFYVLDTSALGGAYFPGEIAKLTIQVTRGETPLKSVTLHLQEVTSRFDHYLSNNVNGMSPPPALDVLRQCGTVSVPVVGLADTPGAVAKVEATVPLPEENGCYVVTLAPNGKDPQFLCSLARVFKPLPGYRHDAPLMGEFGWLPVNSHDLEANRRYVSLFARMGIKNARHEYGGMTGMKPDGTIDWSELDYRYQACEEAQLQMVNTLGAPGGWFMPMGGPTVAMAPQMLNHTPDPKYAPMMEKWTEELVKRYYKGGKGGLFALEYWNEPWEPLSCAGWESDGELFRIFYKAMYDGAKKGDPNVQCVGACSIMNTEDKFLTGDDRAEWMNRIDAVTDHYVMPPTNYGSMVTKKYGKDLFETETWGAATESQLYQYTVQFLACGDTMINAMYGNMMYYGTPDSQVDMRFPKPSAVATSTLCHFLTGRRFQRMLSLNHLPFAFQFGNDPDAVVMLVGRLQSRLSFYGPAFEPRNVPWGQLLLGDGGTITIDNADGRLECYDMAGNQVFKKQRAFTIPLDYRAYYLLAPQGGVQLVQQRLNAATLKGMRPVEIIARDLGAPVDAPGTQVKVTLHNLLNRPLTGTLTLTPPVGITLKSAVLPVQLAAGESKDVVAEIAQGTPNNANAYDFAYAFASDAGKADLTETLNVLMVKRGTKRMDGTLDDWANDFGVVVRSTGQKVDSTTAAWQPFNKFVEMQPDSSFAELKTAYDDRYFYVAARVYDPAGTKPHARVATRDDNQYFLGQWCDNIAESLAPYKDIFMQDLSNPGVRKKYEADARWPEVAKILAAHPDYTTWPMHNIIGDYWRNKTQRDPNFSWTKQPYGYIKDFWPDSPIGGDRLQFALDVIPGYEGHDLVPDTDRVIEGFHALPDTDYEYSAYDCPDGGGECWRLLAPGVPRGHYMPHQPRAHFDQGAVIGSRVAVKRDGKFTNYEVAIPWTELKDWKITPGTTFGFTFCIGFSDAHTPTLTYGDNKSATKVNGLSMHPYWSGKSSCGVRWTVGQ